MIATVGGITTMWITATAFGLSILAIAALQLEGAGKPHHTSRPQGLVSGIAEGCASSGTCGYCAPSG